MNVSVPKERRPFEYRVGLPPSGVGMFTGQGHTVLVERDAGKGAGFEDQDYINAGAQIVYSLDETLGRADLVLKFARPLMDELEHIRPGSALAGFLHLAAARQDKIEVMKEKSLTVIAYEQIEDEDGYHPVRAPLSQIGGRMVVQIAGRLMQNDHGGRGILLGGSAGVPPAEIVILGAGIVGGTAAATFINIGSQVTVLDVDLRQLQKLQMQIPAPLVTMLSTPYNIDRACSYADVLICAIHTPGERSPIVVTRDMVSKMRPRSVIIDLSIDQGGCVETSRPTNHGSPTYIEEGVTHFCVPNISGVLGRTATHAFFNGAYPYLTAFAELGVDEAIEAFPSFKSGLNAYKGKVIHLQRLGRSGG